MWWGWGSLMQHVIESLNRCWDYATRIRPIPYIRKNIIYIYEKSNRSKTKSTHGQRGAKEARESALQIDVERPAMFADVVKRAMQQGNLALQLHHVGTLDQLDALNTRGGLAHGQVMGCLTFAE